QQFVDQHFSIVSSAAPFASRSRRLCNMMEHGRPVPVSLSDCILKSGNNLGEALFVVIICKENRTDKRSLTGDIVLSSWTGSTRKEVPHYSDVPHSARPV